MDPFHWVLVATLVAVVGLLALGAWLGRKEHPCPSVSDPAEFPPYGTGYILTPTGERIPFSYTDADEAGGEW